jgi:hypothetical protein
MLSNPFNWQWIWVRGPKDFTRNEKVDEANNEASKLCMDALIGIIRSVAYGKLVNEVTDKVEVIKVCCSTCECIACALRIAVERPDNSYTFQQKNWSKK